MVISISKVDLTVYNLMSTRAHVSCNLCTLIYTYLSRKKQNVPRTPHSIILYQRIQKEPVKLHYIVLFISIYLFFIYLYTTMLRYPINS